MAFDVRQAPGPLRQVGRIALKLIDLSSGNETSLADRAALKLLELSSANEAGLAEFLVDLSPEQEVQYLASIPFGVLQASIDLEPSAVDARELTAAIKSILDRPRPAGSPSRDAILRGVFVKIGDRVRTRQLLILQRDYAARIPLLLSALEALGVPLA